VKVLKVVSISIPALYALICVYGAGYNRAYVDIMKESSDCVNLITEKSGEDDMTPFFGHGALPNTFQHATAYTNMRWSFCFRDRLIKYGE
jgi:hypothetical protein